MNRCTKCQLGQGRGCTCQPAQTDRVAVAVMGVLLLAFWGLVALVVGVVL